MSLEQAITDHASALRKLAAAIRATISGASEITTATDKVIADAKKTDAKPASSPNGAKPETTAPKDGAQGGDAKKPAATQDAAAKNPATASPSNAAAPTYDDVKAKVLALSQAKGRDALVALLARHGVTKAPDLAATQYAQVIADAEAIVDGTYDPEAAEIV